MKAAQLASGFFDAQKAGLASSQLPASAAAAYPWLGAAMAPGDQVTGGFFVTGSDYVKYALPQAWAVSLLAWALVAFPRGFDAAGLTPAVQAHVRFGADYLLASHTSPDTFVAQIGIPTDYITNFTNPGRGFWGWPDDAPRNRTAYQITSDSAAGADAAAAASAALAAAAAAMRGADAGWAARAATGAASLYRLATGLNPKPGAAGSYCSVFPCFEGLKTGGYAWRAFISNSVFDDLAWAAAWLHRATGQASYLTDARYWAARHAAEEADPTLPGSWAFNYNNAGWGAEVLLAEAPDGEAARLRVAQFLRAWIDGKNDYGDILLVTKRGLAYLPADTTGGAEREPLPHAAAAALAALAHAAGPGGAALPRAARARLECFALGQITYMLGGQVGRNRGYLTGFGPRAPLAPRQMASSCPPGSRGRSPPACSVPALLGGDPNPSPLAGALVAGPGEDDSYTDARAAPGAGVGVHYNAPLLAALAGLLQSNAGPGQCQGAGGGILRELLSVN